ncbi:MULTISPECIES: hypothetical protein [unclassified Caballeronia]|uniref:hypothetical protein n=1 Tax=unclassified Caballeronia TaxID=2646786 RepID=UPI00202850A0|nr:MULTISPECIES: hypothetical protein [unclassified Caballeronia]
MGILEDAVVGPLYKTVFSKESPADFRLYSVSKLNLSISRCVLGAFALGAIFCVPMPNPADVHVTRLVWTKFLLIVIAAIGAVYIRSEGKAESTKNGINELHLHFTKRDVGALLQHKPSR